VLSRILKDRINTRLSNIIGWATVIIMGLSVAIMFATGVVIDRHIIRSG